MIIAAIGSIANFEKASQLEAYFEWAPQVDASGTSLDKTKLTTAGKRTMRQVMFLVVGNAIRCNVPPGENPPDPMLSDPTILTKLE